ncbi:MAG: thymidylate synthase (FAD), intein-containing [Leptolyngbyaceae cyanobacterium RM2_2_4]|nr:thymidylate synthase (FAD), intein-containing [Leptolyngbyaceae cyanobacterium SM1_4_3]NJN58898.1 thymidylate synthase (FAD), intein-containing [Leptolyngbyaceae cyanobacterium SL_5_9]NJO51569.1 thymidylate synthase (FAD), intein-containing [Leptolyngbyaceae cyanobacterium RM2_2_4]
MDRFTVAVISQTPNPQQVIYAAMHQDYAEGFVCDERDRWPDEEKAGEIIVKQLLAGNRGHYGPLEHPQIVLNCGWFPHSTMQQIRTHRVGISFDVQCLAGDTEVTFVHASGALRRVKISALHDLWANGEQAIRERQIRGRKGEAPGSYRRDCKARLQKMKLRVLNEATGIFEIGHIQSVFDQGIQPVYRLTLEDGKTLDCTENHRLMTTEGWQTMKQALAPVTTAEGEVLSHKQDCHLMTNGTIVGEGLYRDKDWLQTKLADGLTAKEMAKAAGCSVEAIKKWVYIHGLELNRCKPGTPNPWNRGLKGAYRLNLNAEQRQARRVRSHQITRRGSESNFWKGGVTEERVAIGAWTRTVAPQIHEQFDYTCQKCGKRGGRLHAHHLLPVYSHPEKAYDLANLVSVCKPCHQDIHHQSLELEFAQQFVPIASLPQKPKPRGNKLKAHPVKVVQVRYLGMQRTYDLEVAGDWHNFVANGIVVHNSFRYTGQRIVDVIEGKREVEDVFYLRPVGAYSDRQGKRYEYTLEQRQQDLDWCLAACKRYQERINQGFSEEHARGLIPFDVRQHWVLSANVRSLLHLLDLRWKADAQLEAQKLCELIWVPFREWTPAIADWYETNRLKKARLAP